MKLKHDKSPERTLASDDRLRDLLQLHFHPDLGSTYWLQRQHQLGWSIRDRIRTFDDLWLLGPMPLADLRHNPVPHLHSPSVSQAVAAIRCR